jgi:hypothetical protein
MPKAQTAKELLAKSRRDERSQSTAPYPSERMGSIASMLEHGDGSAYLRPQDLEARTAESHAEPLDNEASENADAKPSFDALTAAEMNVSRGTGIIAIIPAIFIFSKSINFASDQLTY